MSKFNEEEYLKILEEADNKYNEEYLKKKWTPERTAQLWQELEQFKKITFDDNQKIVEHDEEYWKDKHPLIESGLTADQQLAKMDLENPGWREKWEN